MHDYFGPGHGPYHVLGFTPLGPSTVWPRLTPPEDAELGRLMQAANDVMRKLMGGAAEPDHVVGGPRAEPR